ncbi:D-alanyl-D-alanine carboxypeptidase [Hathewaya histolytica]
MHTVNISTTKNDKISKNINVNARSAIAIDKDTGIVLYEKSAYDIISMASTTKIMTALVAIDHGELDKKITISKRAAKIKGSTVKYKEGEQITLKELLYGLMFKSGNDAAIAIAEGISGSVEEFLKLMNEEAIKLGTLNTHFESPHGLDSENHYTTSYDLALITAAAKKNQVFDKIVSSKEIKKDDENFTRDYNNINKLLYSIDDCTGVKTGYTGKAGKCLVSSFKANGREIIVVTLNCTPRWKESKKIYEYVKNNFNQVNVKRKGDTVGRIKDKKGKEIPIYIKEDICLPIKKGETYNYRVEIKPDNLIDSNINKDSILGTYKVFKENKEVYSVNIFNKESVQNEKTFLERLKDKI